MRPSLQISVAALSLLAASTAHAGNDDELLAGNEAAMMAGAVSAFVADASAAWYNPAGLGAIERSQVDVSGTVYTLRFYSAEDFIALDTGQSEDASVVEFVSIPTQIAYARRLAPGVVLALGYFVPSATNVVLREQLVADDPDKPSSWQVAIASGRVLHNALAAVGFALAPGVRFGVSAIGSYQSESESSVVFGAVADEQGVQRLLQYTAIGTGSRVAFELGAGLQLDLGARVALGLSVRSPRLQLAHTSDYALTRGMGLGQRAGGPQLDGMVFTDDRPNQQVGLLRAGRYGASISYAYGPRSRVCFEVDIQPGLRDDATEVERKAVINARLGAFLPLSRALALGMGVFTDRSPDILSGNPGNGTGDFYGGTLGLEISNEHALAEGEPADSLIFSTVFALRYAFSRGDMDSFMIDPDHPFATRADGYTASRRTALIAHELGLFVGGGLKF